MIEYLVDRCQREIDDQAFTHLHNLRSLKGKKTKGKKAARGAIEEFVTGFARYLEQHEGNCLLATLALTQPELLGEAQREKTTMWQATLSAACQQLGHKPKAAKRLAQASLARLYGSLTLAAMGSHISINQASKWLKRDLLK